MKSSPKILGLLAASFFAASTLPAATFGTVVPVRGQISDIALDTTRRLIYAANFTANRIEVMSLDSQALQNNIAVAAQPSSIALSPDGHYLVVGHYVAATNQLSASTGLTIIDLVNSRSQVLSLGTRSILTVAFGNSSTALLVMSDGVSLLDPATATITSVSLIDFTTLPLQVPWATFSPEIIKASAGVSGDGNVIYALVDGGPQSILIRYEIATQTLVLVGATSTPALGPRVVSVDQTGASLVAGWVLVAPIQSTLVTKAQFPYPPGILNQGGHAFDPGRNLIYAQVAAGTIQAPGSNPAIGAPLLHVLDSDNLTVREILQLRENLAGKALLNGDTMYAISDSGIAIFPIGTLSKAHRIKSVEESVVFLGNGCDQLPISQYIEIVDPGGLATDFSLTTSSPGVTISPSSGVTPMQVRIMVDPSVFQASKGTAIVTLQISSIQAVNLPPSVSLLINTRDPNQQGSLHNVAGKIVDVLTDPNRDRFYMLRQDLNLVLVYDGTTFNQIATLRTGNTPVQMAISQDKLLVTNDNSQYVSVFDLSTLVPVAPVYFPAGLYPRSIAVLNSGILTTTRSASATPPSVVQIDLVTRRATRATTGIFENNINPNSVLAGSPSGQTAFMAMPDGTVALWDDFARTFVASRKDITALSGAYAAFSDTVYMAGNHLFNSAVVPVGQIDLGGGISSGLTMANGLGLLTTAPAGSRNGLIERFSVTSAGSIAPTRMPESPLTADSITTAPVGQIGQTILPFTRTLALLPTGQTIVQLSTSGFSVLPMGFDTPLQAPVINAVTNAADLGPSVAAGGLITIWGSGMSTENAAATSVPLPKGLGGVCLYADSIPLPMLYVSPSQINAQLPFNSPPSPKLTVISGNGQSQPFNLPVQTIAPAMFRTQAGGPLIIRLVDGKYITDATPIHLDEKLVIYLTGMGPVSVSPNVGDASPSTPLATTTTIPLITIGGKSIFTLWSGLAPGMVGVYQINAQVPFRDMPTGSNLAFTITIGGFSTTVRLRMEE